MRKLFAMLLVLVMVFSLAATATAATITISGGANRNFNAYKLLDASIDEEKEAYTYTVNHTYLAILADIAGVENNTTATDYNADDVAEGIMTWIRANLTTTASVQTFANEAYRMIQADGKIAADEAIIGADANPTVDLEQGYWLIADVTDYAEGSSQANSVVMVDTVGTVSDTIYTKPDVPEIEKKVSGKTGFVDSADYAVGDTITYQITMTMPNNMSSYEEYFFLMRDTMSEGLELTGTLTMHHSDGHTGTVVHKDAAGAADAHFLYEVVESTRDLDGDNVAETVNILYVYPNTAPAEGEEPVDDYSVTTHGADILKLGTTDAAGKFTSTVSNDDILTLTYTCKLTEDAVIGEAGNPNWAELIFSNDPYGTSWGKTVEDVAVVFTWQFVINKTDSLNNPLEGAKFTLWKFVESANGKETDNKKTGDWVRVGDMTEEVTYDETDTEKVTKATHTLSGLDDGHYKLVETAPAGYTAIEDVHFDIITSLDHEFDTYQTTGLVIELKGEQACDTFINLTATKADGTVGNDQLVTTIQNTTGTKLPETGGIGTTLFYIIGGLMTCGAVVLLVTKKRMESEA